MRNSSQTHLPYAGLSQFPVLHLGGHSRLLFIKFSFAYSFPRSFILHHSLGLAVGLETIRGGG